MFAWLKLNPRDNEANLNADYIRELENQSGRMKRRFLDGEYGEVAPGQLWTEELLDKYRCDGDEELPEMQRIVVAIDPSGASDEDNKENDEIGIVVVGLGTDGRAYLLEDLTCKGGPGTWGDIAVNAYDRHMADRIVAETNYGGDMVRFVVQAATPGVPFKKLTASRGKVVRAEPIAGLHEQGKIRFSGRFVPLEEELCAFTTTGYVGEGSPNRADAFVWAVTELFPGVIKAEKKRMRGENLRKTHAAQVSTGTTGWLSA
jgi:phage terminase large subunit-like protein